jgi:ppGpp synthetase/RelA/SpoT-type nucleotidyltranferase
MTRDEAITEYSARYEELLKPLAIKLEELLRDHLEGVSHIDRIGARAKSPQRFADKAVKVLQDGTFKYSHPLEQVQDLVGVRVVVFYKQDVDIVSKIVEKYFTRIEKRDIVPDSESSFGYVGKHFILTVPADVIADDDDTSKLPKFFELQIKTLFQHAWSEANHDLAYKPESELSSQQSRLIAFTAAQAWGADHHFAQLHAELNGAPPATN